MIISYIIEIYIFFIYISKCVCQRQYFTEKREGPLSKFASGPMISLDGPDHSSLWTKATTHERLQRSHRCYLRSQTVTRGHNSLRDHSVQNIWQLYNRSIQQYTIQSTAHWNPAGDYIVFV